MLLQLTNVRKYYRSFLAIDIAELSIDKGIWWLQGENGSGKTTLLKIVAGITPFEGVITLNELINLRTHRTHYLNLVNYAEAEPLYPSFVTGKDLVELYCKTKRSKIEEALELIHQLHIYDAYKNPIATYSSGMVKKLSLVLSFIGNPHLILLDEPLITLDTQAIDIICRAVLTKYKEGISFIIASHQFPRTDQLAFTSSLAAANRSVNIL